MPRTITGPDWDSEYGTADQCARYVGIEPPVWRALHKTGLIPSPARLSRQTAYWHWTVAVGVSLLLPGLMAKLESENPVKGKRAHKLDGSEG